MRLARRPWSKLTRLNRQECRRQCGFHQSALICMSSRWRLRELCLYKEWVIAGEQHSQQTSAEGSCPTGNEGSRLSTQRHRIAAEDGMGKAHCRWQRSCCQNQSPWATHDGTGSRSEEHTSELQSLR